MWGMGSEFVKLNSRFSTRSGEEFIYKSTYIQQICNQSTTSFIRCQIYVYQYKALFGLQLNDCGSCRCRRIQGAIILIQWSLPVLDMPSD